MDEIGFVKSVKNFLVYLDGLPTAKVNDLVESDTGVKGLVSALLKNSVEVLLLDEEPVKLNQTFKKTGQRLTIPVGEFLLGRAINPLSVPIDGKGLFAKSLTNTSADLDKPAFGIGQREFIKDQFKTGITLLDSLIPIGRGQRELVVCDARSGKTEFLIDIINNQKFITTSYPTQNSPTICIYASIGKPLAELKTTIDALRANKALFYTVIIAAASSDPAPLIYLTPQTAFAIAEYFQSQGKNVLVILDDMGNHAKIYREISLLADRSAGRESYPGDIFYVHAHLLERAGNFKKEVGGGSITCLPVIELNLADFTTFIPTNLMSMTDGHIMFKSALYNQGQRPAIDLSLSVTRVGQQTQSKVANLLATRIKQTLAQAEELETVSKLSFELPFATRLLLLQKEQIEELLRQMPLTFIPEEIQLILLSLPYTTFFQNKDKNFISRYKDLIIKAFAEDPQLSQITKSVLTLKSDIDLIKRVELAGGRLGQMTTNANY